MAVKAWAPETRARRQPPTLAPVRPNAGVQRAYQRKLERQLKRMQESLVYWISAAYRANQPEIASDESPAMVLRKSLRALTRRWNREFAKLAEQYSPLFVDEVRSHTDRAFAAQLRRAGFTVRLKLSPAVNDVTQAAVGENVSLIKSIASEHLTQVEGIVMRSVQRGRALGELTADLQERYGVTFRRAALIARDQNNKATSAINEARQLQMGITEAVWVHTGAGKTQRASHVAANGKRYEVGKGMLLDGRWVRPGEEINCHCVSRSIIPGFS